jgi:hypothetical protein
MTLVRRLINALWSAIAKVLLPDPVLRLDQLDVDLEQIKREYAQLIEKRRRKTRLEATWARPSAAKAAIATSASADHDDRGRSR